MVGKHVSEVSEADLRDLVVNGVAESQTLDYKLLLPGTSDSEKKEFLADVSAMANTAGGTVVYGVETKRDAGGNDTGIADSTPGLAVANFDAERLRLESLLRDGLSPPITYQSAIVRVPLTPSSSVVLVGIARSVLAPHRVTFKGGSRFWRRSQSGKYEPSVPELRRMFLEQTEWTAEALAFRDARMADVESGRAFPNLGSGPQAFVHVLPLGRRGEVLDLRGRDGDLMGAFAPITRVGGYSRRYNFDGFLTYSPLPDGTLYSYTQVFRNGAVEAFSLGFAAEPEGQVTVRRLWAEKLRRELEAFVPPLLRSVRGVLGVEPPYVVCISLNGIEGAVIPTPYFPHIFGSPIDREKLQLEPLVVEDPGRFTAEALLPLLDVVWQSAGMDGVPR